MRIEAHCGNSANAVERIEPRAAMQQKALTLKMQSASGICRAHFGFCDALYALHFKKGAAERLGAILALREKWNEK